MCLENVLQIIDTIVTAGVGIWIGVKVQSNFTKSRAKRNFYIEEIKEVRRLYSIFLKDLYNDRYTGKGILDWNKVMTERLKILEKHINSSYRIEKLSIRSVHFDMYSYISGTPEFNDSWNKNLVLPETLKNGILEKYSALTDQLHTTIVLINECRTNKKK